MREKRRTARWRSGPSVGAQGEQEPHQPADPGANGEHVEPLLEEVGHAQG